DSANDLNLNFSIEETSESMGSTELIKDLLSPETQITDVDDLEVIQKETSSPQKPIKSKVPVVEKKEEEEIETNANDSQNLITNFLETENEEEEVAEKSSIEKEGNKEPE